MRIGIGFTFILFLKLIPAWAQPNCNIYERENNQACYQACLKATNAEKNQGSRASQLLFDEAIQQCPNLAYAYFEKSVPYLKRGEFASWKKLIDKAVDLEPIQYLSYRGWCRFQFLRDYKGAINDLDRLSSLAPYDIGFSNNGDYHLMIVEALCYKGLGEKKKAIEIIQKQLAKKDYSPGLYDYLHLGILNMEIGEYKLAIENFKDEIKYNDYFAETYFYMGMAYKELKNDEQYVKNIKIAKEFYTSSRRKMDPYISPVDKVYLSDIDKELEGK